MPQPDRTIPNPRTVPRPYTEDLLGEAGQGEWRGLEAERWGRDTITWTRDSQMNGQVLVLVVLQFLLL